jgi:DNA-binding NtrC family response regulator
VLVVEDEPEIAALMRDFLEADGFRVLLAPDAEAAAGPLATGPDCVQHRRVGEQGCREPEPLPHPEREAARLPSRHPLQTGLLDHLVDPARGEPLRVSEPEQMVAGTPARMQRGRI